MRERYGRHSWGQSHLLARRLVAEDGDPDAGVAKAFDLPGGYKFHGQTVHFPGLVLLDMEGKEVFRYVGKNNSDRLPYEKFSEKVKELMTRHP